MNTSSQIIFFTFLTLTRRDAVDAESQRVSRTLYHKTGKLLGSNMNRGPVAYRANPQELLDLYKEEGDTDKNMTVLIAEDNLGNLDGLFRFRTISDYIFKITFSDQILDSLAGSEVQYRTVL